MWPRKPVPTSIIFLHLDAVGYSPLSQSSCTVWCSTPLSKSFISITSCILLYIFLGETNAPLPEGKLKASLQNLCTVLWCTRHTFAISLILRNFIQATRSACSEILFKNINTVNSSLSLTSHANFHGLLCFIGITAKDVDWDWPFI